MVWWRHGLAGGAVLRDSGRCSNATSQVVGILLINLVLSAVGGVLYTKLKPSRRVAFITLDADDLIPPQAEDDAAVVDEPAEEPEPEADEPDDETPAGPQWFETPYPDPDTELKAEEATKA